MAVPTATLLDAKSRDDAEQQIAEMILRVAGEIPIDLVITHLVMPDTEGREIIQQFRKCFEETEIIAIACAAVGEYLRIAQLLGADAVFRKPFDAADLLKSVINLPAH